LVCAAHVVAEDESLQIQQGLALNSLKGQVMKLSNGKANPNLVGEIQERKLKN
jgi:aspartyl-tRNA(Asn)/glutamyl-tRNA(Gln) amidotransferase subunit B